MSKGLKALKELKNELEEFYGDFIDNFPDELELFTTIEKELKALEIIIKKNVLPSMLNDTLMAYNSVMLKKEEELTQEEYDLLREVLL